jgi:MFS transporter, putative metabolite:H+ symporter
VETTTQADVDTHLKRRGGITYRHRGWFWIGVLAVTTGVALHLPMFFDARKNHYRLVGMKVDGTMMTGMALIVAGFLAVTYGLLPHFGDLKHARVANVRVRALDDAPITRSHIMLLLVMAAAVTIDITKPTTLSFVVPGMAKEYHLRPAFPHAHTPVAYLPLAGIGGTVLGSFLWGWLGDRIGRRASVLLAGVVFIGTSICGSMPSFHWNLFMCFIMGLAVGGMLPIAFALLSETIPARHRGWLMVLVGGDVAGAYIITSNLASWLEPHYGWRIMWLLGLPSGVLLILLNRWIPESPRFLLANGRATEAHEVMARFGATIVPDNSTELHVEERVKNRFDQLVRPPFGGISLGLLLFGVAYGLVNFGLVLWLPTDLRHLGLGVGTSDRLLADSALIGFPATFVVALLYGFWSSKKTMVGLATLTSATLVAFALLGNDAAKHRAFLEFLIVLLLVGVSSVLAVLTPYSAEVYPTRLRSRGTGLVAGASKAGGVLGIGLVALSIALPSITGSALLGAIPMALAAVAIGAFGIETRKRRLEEITADELDLIPPARPVELVAVGR